ncbi:Os08g0491600 [Oryza sativa Japonica Group]|uniref:Os08g0491600 protein n=1 Tax=Oryza sativa subsp. japonica TaxID=39947 RepID=A0A0P0XHI5_ORYSJ|nr:Os08g0491600 [Oryza sativa Japonica Group]
MKRKREDAAADGEITAAVSRAGTSSSSFGGAAICDDVVRNIFARLPARDAVASMALSWHHRRLITSPDFVRLHCRHGAPLPRPHIAYVATAPVVTHRDMLARINSLQERGRQRERYDDPEPDRFSSTSRYHGFHVAGAADRRHQPDARARREEVQRPEVRWHVQRRHSPRRQRGG